MTRLSDIVRKFLLGFIVYFGLAVASVLLARVSHNVAVFWPANAVLVSMAMAMSRRDAAILLFSGLIANAATQLVYGDIWQLAVGFPLANFVEMVSVYTGFQLLKFQSKPIVTPRRGLVLLAVVALAAVPAAGLGSLTVSIVFGGAFSDAFVHWWAGDIVSSMIVYLPVFSAHRGTFAQNLKRYLKKENIAEWAVLGASFGFGFVVLLFLHLPPAIVLIFPTLWLALKGKVFEVAMVSSVLSLATSAAVVMGYWPSIAVDLPLRDAVFQQQTLALFCTFPSFLIAVAISNLEISQANLAARKNVLDITLSNMNQGVSVFDENHNLVLWNEQYLQAFNMNESDVFTGKSFLSLLELQKERGDFAGEPMDLVNKIMSHVRRGEAYLTDTVLGTGRFIKTAHSPTPVGGWIGTHEDVTDIRELEQRLAHESLHDVLTGVPNRRYFERELTERLLMAQRNMSPVALFTLDLDKFKVINDTYGHDVGDDVLLRAATIIRDVVGQDDFVARMGGDEFIVIVSGEHEIARLQRVAKSLCERLDQTARIKGNLCVCRASVGVAFSKDGQVSRHDLLTQSDIALYTAKQAGRGSYKVYDFASGQHQSNQLAS